MTYDDLKADFRLLLFLVWRHLDLPDPTPTQLDIAEYLQHGPHRTSVLAFRGVGKSWITAVFVVWYLMNNPNANVVVVSANADRAEKFTTFVLRLIHEVPQLHHLRPQRGQRSSALGFDIGIGGATQTQSCTAVGITGNMTGDRGDLIVFDDIEIPSNSETPAQREKIANRSREASGLLKPGGRIVYLGTFQSQESVYMGLTDRGFDMRIWPVMYPNQEQRAALGPYLAPRLQDHLSEDPGLVGDPTEPSRFDVQEIEERRRDYGPAGFELQFMLNPALSDVDRYPLKQADLLVYPLDPNTAPARLIHAPVPENEDTQVRNVGMRGDRIYRAKHITPEGEAEFRPYATKLMAIDPSGRGRDETGYAVLGSLDGYIYLLDAGGVPGVEEKDLRRLCEIARQYDVNVVASEPNYGGGIFSRTMQQALDQFGFECSVRDAEWARGQKERRIIETLRPAMGAHRLVVDRDLFERDFRSVSHLPEQEGRHYRLFHQLTNITMDRNALKHDDRVEPVAIGVNELQREVSTNPQRVLQARRDEALEKELREVYDNLGVGGSSSTIQPRA